MKIFKSPQNILILFLSVLIVISFIMIVRLEGKAASFQTQWEEHQKSLKANEDVLYDLDVFSRMVKKNSIKVDGNNIILLANNTWVTLGNNDFDVSTNGNIKLGSDTDNYLGYDSQKKLTYINHDGAQVTVGNITIAGKKLNGVLVRSANGNTQLVMTDKVLSIATVGKDGEYRLELKPEKGIFKITKGKSELIFEKDNVKLQVESDVEIGPSDKKNFGYRKSEDLLYMLNKDSKVTVGPVYRGGKFVSNGIMLISKTDGPQLSVYDKVISMGVPGKDLLLQINLDKEMIGMKQGQSTIKLEKNKLEIKVEGDINITSKNGTVNINGKKVNLNK